MFVRITVFIASCGMALAASRATIAASQSVSMSCCDFLAIDDGERPNVVYWAEGVSHKGKPEDAGVGIEATNRLVPAVVQVCKAAPQASFWTKVDTEWRKIVLSAKKHL